MYGIKKVSKQHATEANKKLNATSNRLFCVAAKSGTQNNAHPQCSSLVRFGVYCAYVFVFDCFPLLSFLTVCAFPSCWVDFMTHSLSASPDPLLVFLLALWMVIPQKGALSAYAAYSPFYL